MNDEFDLEDFLKNNQQLFTVMGIFGAISIYLITINKDIPEGFSKDMLQFGIPASLILFLITSWVIFQNLIKKRDERIPLSISLFIFRWGNIMRFIFAIPFLILIISICFYIIINYYEPLKLTLGLGLSPISIMVFFGIFVIILEKVRYKIMVSVCFLSIITSAIALYFSNEHNLINLMWFFGSLFFASLLTMLLILTDYLNEKAKNS